MRRDIGNELMVAIGAIGVLAIALIFAVLLSLSANPEVVPSQLETAANTASTNVSEMTITATTSDISSPQPTAEEVTSTNTPTPVATETPRTVIRVASATPVPTDTLSPTRRPTRTPRPPTATDVPPTRTPTATYTPTITLTEPPTATMTLAASATPLAGNNCSLPDGWQTYTLSDELPLAFIASATGSSIAELALANCLTNIYAVTAGSTIFVPRNPEFTTPVTLPDYQPQGCQNPQVQITAPQAGQVLAKTNLDIVGSAIYENFWYYKVEYRPDWAEVYTPLDEVETTVEGDVLYHFDTTSVPDGLYWLRLAVVNNDAKVPEDASCAIPIVLVDMAADD